MRFSICIPAYKTAAYLPRCLDSLLAQTFTDFEAIIVDDGSPDDVAGIAEDYARRDTRFKVVRQINKGLFYARIAALRVAQGDYVMHVDSDDWIVNGCLQVLNDFVETHGTDLVVYNYKYVYANGRQEMKHLFGSKDFIWQSKSVFLTEFLSTNKVNSICRKLMKRELIRIDKIENMPRIQMTEDWIHSFYPVMNATRVGYCHHILYCYYKSNEDSLTSYLNESVFLSANIIHQLKINNEEVLHLLTQADIDKQYLSKIAKFMMYGNAKVRSKESYQAFASEIRRNDLFNIVLQRSGQTLSWIDKIPINLISTNHLNILYFGKQICWRIIHTIKNIKMLILKRI